MLVSHLRTAERPDLVTRNDRRCLLPSALDETMPAASSRRIAGYTDPVLELQPGVSDWAKTLRTS